MTFKEEQLKISKSMRILVAFPAYNEELTIGSLILKTKRYVDEVLVIDDGSKDRTSEVAQLAGANVIRNDHNIGKGKSIEKAFNYAKSMGYEILVLLDADGQHNPDEIPRLLLPIKRGEADISIGSRFLGNEQKSIPMYRKFGIKIIDFMTNKISKSKISDTQCGFRAFYKNTFDIFSFRQENLDIESGMIIEASEKNLKIKEVPVEVRYDIGTHSKNPVRHGLSIISNLLGIIEKKHPLLYFWIPGSIFLLLGLAGGIRVLMIFNKIEKIPIGTALLTILFIILGVLSIYSGVILHSVSEIIKGERD